MIFVKYNKSSNAIIDISTEDFVNIDNTIFGVKIVDLDIVNLHLYKWEENTLTFIPNASFNNIVSKIEFRSKFTFTEQLNIDEFNDNYLTSQNLDDHYKRMIRTCLKLYNDASDIDMNNPFVELLLGIYVEVGILTLERSLIILNTR